MGVEDPRIVALDVHGPDRSPARRRIARFRGIPVGAWDLGKLNGVDACIAIGTCASAAAGVAGDVSVIAPPGNACHKKRSIECHSAERSGVAADPTLGISILAVIQVGGEVERNAKLSTKITRAERDAALSRERQIVRDRGGIVGRGMHAVIAVESDGKACRGRENQVGRRRRRRDKRAGHFIQFDFVNRCTAGTNAGARNEQSHAGHIVDGIEIVTMASPRL